MCVYLFHPGSHLKVKFATEAIDLKDGSSIDVIDLLLKNDSSSALDRVHLVYPHPIPLEQSETRFFKDETATWLDPGHRFNTYGVSTCLDHTLHVVVGPRTPSHEPPVRHRIDLYGVLKQAVEQQSTRP